jgi:acetolactate synthase-1/2/3 large subunit
MGTRAVGAGNMAIGIHTARQNSTPLIALIGQVERAFRGREAFQESELVETPAD